MFGPVPVVSPYLHLIGGNHPLPAIAEKMAMERTAPRLPHVKLCGHGWFVQHGIAPFFGPDGRNVCDGLQKAAGGWSVDGIVIGWFAEGGAIKYG